MTNYRRTHLRRRGFPCPRQAFSFALLLFFLSRALPLHGEELVSTIPNKDTQEVRGNPAARLLAGEFSSEHWEFTARFDSGHFLFVHFLITNIGWGDRNAVVIGHVVTPEGEVRQFGNARRKKNWELSADRLRFEISSNVLDMHDPQYRLQVNKKKIRFDLRFHADTLPAWSETLTQSGYALDLLATAVSVDGVLWVAGMAEPLNVHGTLAATHSWMQETGGSTVVRRVEFFSLREDLPIYGIDLTTPHSAPFRWLVIKQPGKQQFATDAFEFQFGPGHEPQQDPRYTVPREIQLRSAQLNGQLHLDHIILRHDPFAYLPGPLRFLVSTILNLHPLQVWASSPFVLLMHPPPAALPHPSTISTKALTQQGTGVIAITFLNPLPETR